MATTRKALAVLAAFIATGLPAARAVSQDVERTSAHETTETAASSEITELQSRLAALESQLHQGMAGGYEANVYDAQGMPGGYAHDSCGCGPEPAHGCGPGGCADVCAGRCCNCCCPYNPWMIGGGVYHLKPHWKTNPAFSTEVTVGAVDTRTQTDFDYDADVAPFVWIAYRGSHGVGIQARGWWYDDDESIALVNDGTLSVQSAAPLGLSNLSTTAGDALTFDSSLEIDVVDLLLTYLAQFECGSLEFAAGARYARVEQSYRHREVPLGGLVDSVDSSHRFSGAGPSFSLEGRLPATRRLSLFGTLRYSLLFGHARQEAALTSNNVLTDRHFQENDDVLPIAELDLGAEYAIRIGCSELFLSAALVSQVWQGAGNSANNEIIVTNDEPENVADKNADLGLWGFRAELGARF